MSFKEEPRIITQTLGQKGPGSLKHTLVGHGAHQLGFDPTGCVF